MLEPFESSCRLVASLEGQIATDDSRMALLSNGQAHEDERLCAAVADKLARSHELPDGSRITRSRDEHLSAVRMFLSRTIVLSHPNRALIEDRNIRLLGERQIGLSYRELREMHEKLLAMIVSAMRAHRPDRGWETVLRQNPADARLHAKRLTQDRVAPLVASLRTIGRPLLRPWKSGEPFPHGQSSLVRKLQTGGASRNLVETATGLRAQVDSYILQRKALNAWPSAEIVDDVDQELLVLAHTVVERWEDDPAPAKRIFHELHERLQAASSYDYSHAFGGKPSYLLGRICSLSDECKIAWGVANA